MINKKLIKQFLKVLCFCLTCLKLNIGQGQNLVMNPSFEEVIYCPYMEQDTTIAKHWHIPYSGTTDYYNSCSELPKWRVPKNWFGTYRPRTGSAYAGIIPIGENGYMEHIQGILKNNLTKGKKYKIIFWVRFADSASNYSTWKIGAHLSNYRILNEGYLSFKNKYQELMTPAYIPHIEQKKGEFITKKEWVKIEGEYIAKGDERYITIGCFYGNSPKLVDEVYKYRKTKSYKSKTSKIKYFKKCWLNKYSKFDKVFNEPNKGYPYYFIDDVSVELIEDE